MPTLTCIETYIDKDESHYGSFLIEPLETGQGITLGNSLRRTLLSDLTGFSIIGARINNLKHEFSIIEGLREDILEVLLNLKEIVFKKFAFAKTKNNLSKLQRISKLKGFLNIKGPAIVTAGMFNLPKNLITILNPNQYIATIIDDSELYIEIDITNGRGYRLKEDHKKETILPIPGIQKPSTLFVDALFMPVKRVNYKIKLIHDTQGNIKESLNIEIWTNRSITPKRSFQEAVKILMNLFYPLFLTNEFLTISSDFSKKNGVEKSKIKKIKKTISNFDKKN